jgi:hypothetical protein
VDAQKPRRCGRPSKLDDELADRLVTLLAAGTPLGAAAVACDIAPRTLQLWRARAWSDRVEDRAHVELEKRVREALVVAAARERGRVAILPDVVPVPWEVAAAALELAAPERWAQRDRE